MVLSMEYSLNKESHAWTSGLIFPPQAITWNLQITPPPHENDIYLPNLLFGLQLLVFGGGFLAADLVVNHQTFRRKPDPSYSVHGNKR